MTTNVDDDQPQPSTLPSIDQPAASPDPTHVHTEVHVEEAQLLLNSGGTATTNVYLGSAASAPEHRLDGLVEELPPLPSDIRLFRDPRHDQFRDYLENERILLLSSHQGSAASAAAHSLVSDDHFSRHARRACYPTRGRDKDRADLDLHAVADEEFLGREPQILVIEIDGHCAMLDSALKDSGAVAYGRLVERLKRHGSHVILVVNEDLVANRAGRSRIVQYSVSHLRYLLDATGRVDYYERRLLNLHSSSSGAMDIRDLYSRVAERVNKGTEALEEFVCELERVRAAGVPAVTPGDVFREESETHRAASFIGTYFPDIGPHDFDRLVLTLLGDQTATVERTRQIVSRDGILCAVHEERQERWADRWDRAADGVFRECYLTPISSSSGAWLIDFSEPYLRRELRAYFERHHSWYLKRQCQTLSMRGVFFAPELSDTAVEALVRLFVERAVVDPLGFGRVLLTELVLGVKSHLNGQPSATSQEEVLAWLLDKLAAQPRLRSRFYERMTLLIRQMLDREPLQGLVREFFEFLITARRHNAVLDVIFDLSRRLRFAPHFDPFVWMRRLLDQGSTAVRNRTAGRLVMFARDSGPRIYEFLAVIRTWLPDPTRAPERFSESNRVAIEFPLGYCRDVALALPEGRFGQWPSHHPLFYALPAEPAEARRELGTLVEWILDARGAALESSNEADPTLSAEARRIAYVGDLIEHWAWVLEGKLNEGHPSGRALFEIVAEEIDQRLTVDQRTWLQRSWLRRQDNYIAQAASSPAQRTLMINRRVRLEQLRRRFTQVPQPAGHAL